MMARIIAIKEAEQLKNKGGDLGLFIKLFFVASQQVGFGKGF